MATATRFILREQILMLESDPARGTVAETESEPEPEAVTADPPEPTLTDETDHNDETGT